MTDLFNFIASGGVFSAIVEDIARRTNRITTYKATINKAILIATETLYSVADSAKFNGRQGCDSNGFLSLTGFTIGQFETQLNYFKARGIKNKRRIARIVIRALSIEVPLKS
jgi:hypothetical protein